MFTSLAVSLNLEDDITVLAAVVSQAASLALRPAHQQRLQLLLAVPHHRVLVVGVDGAGGGRQGGKVVFILEKI